MTSLKEKEHINNKNTKNIAIVVNDNGGVFLWRIVLTGREMETMHMFCVFCMNFALNWVQYMVIFNQSFFIN